MTTDKNEQPLADIRLVTMLGDLDLSPMTRAISRTVEYSCISILTREASR